MPQEHFGCVGSSIITASGKYIDLANPDPDCIDIRDIAKALSNLCRFGGHTRCFYSVAEHSWWCSRVAYSKKYTMECQQAVSLHDASEAYLQDIVKPLKVLLPQYQELEQRMMGAIQRKFGVNIDRWKVQIDAIDHSMLIAERNFLFGKTLSGWAGEDEVEKFEDLRLACFSPRDAELRLMDTFHELGLCKHDCPPCQNFAQSAVELPVSQMFPNGG